MRAEGVDTMRLPGGRLLAWGDYGDPRGRALVVLHGVPGSHVLAGALGSAARERGVRIVAPDRPGYGRSEPDRETGFRAFCEDLRVLLDHLGLVRVTVAGISGGAGYAVSAATNLADRVDAVFVVSGMAPSTGGLDVFLARRAPWLLCGALRGARAVCSRGRGGGPLLLAGLSRADRRAVRASGLSSALGADVAEALRQGGGAAVRDLRRYRTETLAPDGAAVTVPVTILHGDADRSVPPHTASAWAALLPTATVRVIPGAGHLMVFTDPHILLDRV